MNKDNKIILTNEEYLKMQAKSLADRKKHHKEYKEKLAAMSPEEREKYKGRYVIPEGIENIEEYLIDNVYNKGNN